MVCLNKVHMNLYYSCDVCVAELLHSIYFKNLSISQPPWRLYIWHLLIMVSINFFPIWSLSTTTLKQPGDWVNAVAELCMIFLFTHNFKKWGILGLFRKVIFLSLLLFLHNSPRSMKCVVGVGILDERILSSTTYCVIWAIFILSHSLSCD